MIVAVGEAHHLPIGHVPIKVERLEWKVLELARDQLLFLDRQNLRIITGSLRQPGERGEQIGPSGN
jgi:hypothetical protein